MYPQDVIMSYDRSLVGIPTRAPEGLRISPCFWDIPRENQSLFWQLLIWRYQRYGSLCLLGAGREAWYNQEQTAGTAKGCHDYLYPWKTIQKIYIEYKSSIPHCGSEVTMVISPRDHKWDLAYFVSTFLIWTYIRMYCIVCLPPLHLTQDSSMEHQ